MRTLFFSIGVISAVFISLQISLVRILSVLLSYHFVFSIVSLSMLGLGLGGVIVQKLSLVQDPIKSLSNFLFLSFISIVFSLLAIIWMAQNSLFFDYYYAYFLVLLLPFVFGGSFFSQLYQSYSTYSSQLYAADLFGAALGCLLGVMLLNWLGALNSVLILAVVIAAVLWHMNRGKAAKTVFLVSVLLLCIGLWSAQNVSVMLGAERNPIKEISDALKGPLEGTVTRSIWSAFGLTEQVEYQGTDEHRDIYIDGTAGTPMYAFSGDFDAPGKAVQNLFEFFPGALPFKVIPSKQEKRALIIGPGGGRDVLLAAGSGFKEVVGVEVNPDLLSLVKEQSDYNGGLYTDFEHIKIFQAEGRHFVKQDESRYDLIMLSLPVTNTSRSPEGFALTENFLLTVEAIEDYLEHLTNDGLLMIIAHDELAVLRLIMLAIEAYERIGLDIQQVFRRLYVQGSFPYPIVLFSKSPIDLDVSQQLLQESWRRNYSMNASFFPGIISPGLGNPMLQALAVNQLTTEKVYEYVAGMGFNISSVSDDRPFFYHFELKPPKNLMVLFYMALATVLASWIWSGLIGFRCSKHSKRVRLPAFSLAFLSLGVGFMLIEIVFIQKLTFYLGNPIVALALLLSILLCSMAIGSRLSARFNNLNYKRSVLLAALLVCVVGCAYQVWLPLALNETLSWSLLMRLLLGSALLFPLGVLLGLCFPLLLRMLQAHGYQQYIAWMWAINGFSSVVGASAAVLGGIYMGFQAVFWLGLGCYTVVALSILFVKASQKGSISAIPRC